MSKYTCCSASCLSSRCCCKRRQKQTIDPAPESAEEILESYRHQMCVVHCNSMRTDTAKNETEKEQTRTDCDDELVLAEEGSDINNAEMLCPICIEPFRIGEQVAWSGLGNCRHVFHYECILPWAVLGNVQCPVCRERFWSRKHPCIRCHNSGTGNHSEMRQSRFCVQHGLISPQEV